MNTWFNIQDFRKKGKSTHKTQLKCENGPGYKSGEVDWQLFIEYIESHKRSLYSYFPCIIFSMKNKVQLYCQIKSKLR